MSFQSGTRLDLFDHSETSSFCCNSDVFSTAVCCYGGFNPREAFYTESPEFPGVVWLNTWPVSWSLRDIRFWGLGWLCWRLIIIICSVPHSEGQSDNHESLTKSLLLLVEGTELPCSASVLLHLATRHCSVPHALSARTHTLCMCFALFFFKQLDLLCVCWAGFPFFHPCSSRSCYT